MIMEEIEPRYFEELPYNVLPKNNDDILNQLTHNELKKIYHHMFLQMELWFSHNQEKDDHMKKVFKKDLINLGRLIEYQDINEVLIVLEFVMVIVVRGKNSQELLERIGKLPEETLEDLKELIEGTLAPLTDFDNESNY